MLDVVLPEDDEDEDEDEDVDAFTLLDVDVNNVGHGSFRGRYQLDTEA